MLRNAVIVMAKNPLFTLKAEKIEGGYCLVNEGGIGERHPL